jgi:hypothetical protein
MPDIATVNTSGPITTVVRPITAIICPITALIGPVRATIGHITGITGGRGLASSPAGPPLSQLKELAEKAWRSMSKQITVRLVSSIASRFSYSGFGI